MTQSNVMIVESPSKAKTINKYLGHDFTVIASFGHIRDLSPRDGSVRPDEDFAMDWELAERSHRHVEEIVKAVRNADHVYLATDPDREGEAIAWHIQKVLIERKALGKADVQRVTFNEITKPIVLNAMKAPRQIDEDLVRAYLARRALDYLVGFNLSPILWRKLPGSKSAGRVQSVALRMICDREAEIESFVVREYWSLAGLFQTADHQPLTATLTHLGGKKLDKFALTTKAAAEEAVARVQAASYHVDSIEKKQTQRSPYAPFRTSTLQQEASRKLGFSATHTMRLAQKLYEGVDMGGETVGLITYMRTDGVSLSQEAIVGARAVIDEIYGERYLPAQPRLYKTKAKNAQEAHEAIRPTSLSRRPEQVARFLDNDERRLYELIWKRTVASQMASAILDQVAVDVASDKDGIILHATGSVVAFDGFLRVYQESRDDDSVDGEDGTRLPPVKQGEVMALQNVLPEQHFTQPPARYTEASLVKAMEEFGIGRPSTYASIMQVLRDRTYVRMEKKAFVPEDRGRLVTAFLASFFTRYVQYDFTADLEEKLDDISGGREDWKAVMRDFWTAFSATLGQTKDLTITQVLDALDADLGPHFFPETEETQKLPHGARTCPSCGQGRLSLKLGKFGAFVGCSQYPTCTLTRPLAALTSSAEGGEDMMEGPRLLGQDPATGLPVTVRKGPYGAYVQLGPVETPAAPVVAPVKEEPAEEPVAADGEKPKKKRVAKPKKPVLEKPKRVSLLRGMSPLELDFDTALRLLALPRDIGADPETGDMITAGVGRFGPYVKLGPTYKSLAAEDDVLTIGLNRAVMLLAEKKGPRAVAGRVLGEHPADKAPITVQSGRFGPYVKHGKVMATIPKSQSADDITVEQAVALLTAKAEKMAADAPAKPAKAAKTTKAKAPAKAKTTKAAAAEAETDEKPAKKAAVKKPAAKKATTVKKTATTGAAKTTRAKKAKPADTDDEAPF